MGEVFRAYDEDLDRQVAIKLLRPSVLESARSRERFRREARTVAALDHPSIVRIHHVLRWQGGDCIVMELVEGRTLTALLRDGPLDLRRALSLALEITGGLAAAHAQGVVHRDLKTDNVMVTPADRADPGRANPGRANPGRANPGRANPGRAKILDFGLAKWLMADSGDPTLSVEGRIVGTFHSMSPEQAQGDDVDHRSDLFSLGTLLYNVVTGKTPFRGENVTETLANVCIHRQLPARQLNPEVPEQLSSLIDRLLEKKRAHRPRSATEVTTILSHLAREAGAGSASSATAAGSGSGLSGPVLVDSAGSSTVNSGRATVLLGRRTGFARRFAGRKVLLGSVIAMFCVVLGVLVWMHLGAERPSVAVLGFENRTGRDGDAWLSTAISEIVTANLAAGEQIRTVGPGKTTWVMNDLSLAAPTRLSAKHLAGLESNLDADFYALGFYETSGDDLRLTLRLQKASTGEIEIEASGEEARQELSQLVHGAAAKLRDELGRGALTAEQEAEVAAAYPSHHDAARLHAEGLDKYRRFDPLGARDDLAKAVEIEGNPLSYAALAEALNNLGMDSEARQAARSAEETATDLPARRLVELEARHLELSRRWDGAALKYRSIFQGFPDEARYGLSLARTQILAGEAQQALETVAALRRLGGPVAGEAEIDLIAAFADSFSGDLGKAVGLASSAVEKAESSGANHLAARALLFKANLLDQAGENRQALNALDKARVRFEIAGDGKGLGDCFTATATVLVKLSDFAQGMEYFERWYDAYRAKGDLLNAAKLGNNFANALSALGRFAEAEELYRTALDLYQRLEVRREAAITRLNLGTVFYDTGRLDQALGSYQDARVVFADLGERGYLATALSNIGEVRHLRGDLDGARRAYETAVAIHRERGNSGDEAYVGFRLGEVFAAVGELKDAEASFQAALEIQLERGERSDAAATRLGLAELAIRQHNFGLAEELAQQAEKELWEIGFEDQAVLAKTVRARSLLERGKLAEARQLAIAAQSHSGRSDDVRVRFETELLAASIEIEAGRTAAGRARLEALAAEAGDKGYGLMVDRVGERLARGSG